ncbi:MAG TPA: hypothetical protein VGJ30_20980, partial [Candidatus Angelobacter sp.]
MQRKFAQSASAGFAHQFENNLGGKFVVRSSIIVSFAVAMLLTAPANAGSVSGKIRLANVST